MTGARRPRAKIVLAKPGLDGHDRGIKVVGMALRDAGAEVVYLGLHQTAEQIVHAALAEDADVIGLSVLSGVHLDVSQELIKACHAAQLDDVAIVVGGVRDVMPVGTAIDDVVDRILTLAAEETRP